MGHLSQKSSGPRGALTPRVLIWGGFLIAVVEVEEFMAGTSPSICVAGQEEEMTRRHESKLKSIEKELLAERQKACSLCFLQ